MKAISNLQSSLVTKFLDKEDKFRLSNAFHEATNIVSFPSGSQQAIPKEWIKINYKTYPRLNRIYLSWPPKFKFDLIDAILQRRSRRDFSARALKSEQFSQLLAFSCGKFHQEFRTYPSAGARYPLEIYVVVNRIEDIPTGLYHYNVKEHSLELIRKGNFLKEMGKLTAQAVTQTESIVIIISEVFDRTRVKYGDRGYRYALIEAGHLAENLYLVAEGLGLGCCTIGGFIDERINELLDLVDTSEKVVYLAVIGTRYV